MYFTAANRIEVELGIRYVSVTSLDNTHSNQQLAATAKAAVSGESISLTNDYYPLHTNSHTRTYYRVDNMTDLQRSVLIP